MADTGLSESLLGKILATARLKRNLQSRNPNTQELRDQAMHAAVGGGGYAPATSSAAHLGTMGAFQPTGNLFEDFDAIMQDPLWATSLGGGDSNYGSWV